MSAQLSGDKLFRHALSWSDAGKIPKIYINDNQYLIKLIERCVINRKMCK